MSKTTTKANKTTNKKAVVVTAKKESKKGAPTKRTLKKENKEKKESKKETATLARLLVSDKKFASEYLLASEYAKSIKRIVYAHEDILRPAKLESISAYKAEAKYAGPLRSDCNVIKTLKLSGAALVHWHAIRRNALHDKYCYADSRLLAVKKLIEAGKLKKVPESLLEYTKLIIKPLVASGHIVAHSAGAPASAGSGASQTRNYLRISVADALDQYLSVAAGDSASTQIKSASGEYVRGISLDVLSVHFYPSVQQIAVLLDESK